MNCVLVIILFFPILIYSQKLDIIKDTVCLSNECFELQELNLHKSLVYCKIQKTFNLLDSNIIFNDFNDRLEYKKKLVKNCQFNYLLRETQYGFENYEIYYNKNNILNISISLQIYGSSFENIKFMTFDMKNDKEIGSRIFKHKKNLMKFYEKKIRDTGYKEYVTNLKHLSQYKIMTSENGDILYFIFVYTNPLIFNERIEILFNLKEIEPYLKSKYLKLPH